MGVREGAFIDRVKLRLRAGLGGSGIISFRREKFVPFGGPDGGDGGRGGHILARVNTGMNTLEKLASKPLIEAGDGEPGGSNNRTGADGADVVLEVPPGTVIVNEETGETVLDVETLQPGEETVIARGGDGGKGNPRFATPTNQAPRKCTPGWPGGDFTAIFELKLVADIGLAGLPNAGKSTLIGSITGARPRIAAYPFTTLQPVLGAINLMDGTSLVIADIPGIIHGAHMGVGLGLDFLRHIERTEMLVFVIELSPSEPSQPAETLNSLRHEIRQHNESILDRPYLVALNKMDLLDGAEEIELALQVFLDECPEIRREDVFVISAAEKRGTEALRQEIVRRHTEWKREKQTESPES